MNKQRKLLLSVFCVAVYAVLYFYLKHSGLWSRYRWTGLAFGVVWALIYVLLRKNDGDDDLGLRWAISFCVVGIIFLLDFLIQHGDSSDGFFVAICIGFGARGLYAHYKSRKLTMENKTAA